MEHRGCPWVRDGAGAPYTIAYGFDTLAVVGASTGTVPSPDKIHTSPDGIVWTPRASQATQQLTGVAYGKTRFVAVADQGEILRSRQYPSADLSALTCSAGPLTQNATQVWASIRFKRPMA